MAGYPVFDRIFDTTYPDIPNLIFAPSLLKIQFSASYLLFPPNVLLKL